MGIFQHQEKPVLMTNRVAMSISRPAAASRNFHTLFLTPRRISGRRKNFLILYSSGLFAHCQSCFNPQVLSLSTHIFIPILLDLNPNILLQAKLSGCQPSFYDALKKEKNSGRKKSFVYRQPWFSDVALKALEQGSKRSKHVYRSNEGLPIWDESRCGL